MLRFAPVASWTIGSAIAGVFYARSRQVVLNDQLAYGQPGAPARIEVPSLGSPDKRWTGKGYSRFDGKLDYHQLTYGSFAGMVSGWVFGKISKMLVTLIVGGLITTEYLQYTGQLDITPYANRVYNWTKSRLDGGVSLDDPSFKLSFISAFLVAAAYA